MHSHRLPMACSSKLRRRPQRVDWAVRPWPRQEDVKDAGNDGQVRCKSCDLGQRLDVFPVELPR